MKKTAIRTRTNEPRRIPRLDDPEALVRWAETRDPETIAEMLEIPVHHVSYPRSGLPGLTCQVDSRPSIFLNEAYFDAISEQDPAYTEENREDDKRQVLAHELGHSCLHREQLRNAPIRELAVFDVNSIMEAEANRFAALILIDTDEMNELLQEGHTIQQTASALHVNENLLIYRLKLLRTDGNLQIPRSDFMGRIHGTASH